MFSVWNASQRVAVLVLMCVVSALQLVLFYGDFSLGKQAHSPQNVASLQLQIDTLLQKQQRPKHFAFNPNYLSDYAAQQWGMSFEQLQRLSAYRTAEKFVHSPKEFQQVTGVSDSLLSAMTPYFKFPEWVVKKQQAPDREKRPMAVFTKKDINTATQEQLEALRGIGAATAQRIISYRERLGGFSLMEQLSEVWGMQSEVLSQLNKHFQVQQKPNIQPLNINTATKYQLMKVPYLNKNKVEQILMYRSKNGDFSKLEQVLQVPSLEGENLKKLSIYISVE